jgi:hypothetical protein
MPLLYHTGQTVPYRTVQYQTRAPNVAFHCFQPLLLEVHIMRHAAAKESLTPHGEDLEMEQATPMSR